MAEKSPPENSDNTDIDIERGAVTEKSNAQLWIIIGSIILLLSIGGIVGWIAFDVGPAAKSDDTGDVYHNTPVNLGISVYPVIGPLETDLKTGSCSAPFIRLALSVQIDQSMQGMFEKRRDKIIDQITTYLRGVERGELMGEKGSERLRTDVASIINRLFPEDIVDSILFKELLLH